MSWLVLTDGVPPEPSYDDLLAGRDQPQPRDLMTRLFPELAGVSVKASRKLFRDGEIARGYCGNRNVGLVWDSVTPMDTALPMDETYVTYGLPGATLIWAVEYRKRGQLGYATWVNGRLNARLDDHARVVVDRVWTEVFGVAPVFVPAPPEAERAYEDFARQRVEQLEVSRRTRP